MPRLLSARLQEAGQQAQDRRRDPDTCRQAESFAEMAVAVPPRSGTRGPQVKSNLYKGRAAIGLAPARGSRTRKASTNAPGDLQRFYRQNRFYRQARPRTTGLAPVRHGQQLPEGAARARAVAHFARLGHRSDQEIHGTSYPLPTSGPPAPRCTSERMPPASSKDFRLRRSPRIAASASGRYEQPLSCFDSCASSRPRARGRKGSAAAGHIRPCIG